MKFYRLERLEPSRYTGQSNATHKWKLPGVHCPVCKAIWGGGADSYPCVDLSNLEEAKKLEKARLEKDFAEFERLRERIRPLVPAGVPLWPGSYFGPLVGTARGQFKELYMPFNWTLLIRRASLEQLQAEGVQGLVSCRTELRFRQKQVPDLLEVQVESRGLLHPDCIPPDKRTPCAKCGRWGFSLPQEPILDAASLPKHLDVFRLANFSTLIIASERFVDTVRRLQFEEVSFRELPLR